jgi:N-acetylmuramoyl-L-alanine amidase
MRLINYIVIHTTATVQDVKVESILNYWKNNLGWANPGYHFLIEASGKIHQLQPLEKPSNGVRGFNKNSVHISYIGGKFKDDRTIEQIYSMTGLVKGLSSVYPKAKIQGHRDFPHVTKLCPNFDVKTWLETI